MFVKLALTSILLLQLNYCSCWGIEAANVSVLDAFAPAVATFYYTDSGSLTGGGGACGFDEGDLAHAPYFGHVSAGNQNLFKQGKGCGVCYQVRCSENPACSGSPITVTITDECPGACNNQPIHFDLSVNAFGDLAKPGQAETLRKAGIINIDYQRVPCAYGANINFKVDTGSNQFYLAFALENVNGDGEVGGVEIKPGNSDVWSPMQSTFGAQWKYDIRDGTTGPYSVRITGAVSGQSVVAADVIPANWAPGSYYLSNVNF